MSVSLARQEHDHKGRFLRSINVALDAGHVERIAHFRPTRKSILLIRALMGLGPDAATVVVAPYGSGKSIAAAYALEAVENRPESRPALRKVEAYVRDLEPDLGGLLARRRQAGVGGLCIPLVGHQPNIAAAVKASVLDAMNRTGLGRERRSLDGLPAESTGDLVRILEVLEAKLSRRGWDRYFVVWDEFGRHLEGLVSQGQGHELHDVQVLAERVARAKEVQGALGLLLHQSLLQYTSALPQSVRRDWKKIEGRFHVVQFVDDSLEISHLIAQIVNELPGMRRVHAQFAPVELSRDAIGRSWFPGASEAELAEILTEASPIEPAALFLLPRLSARVAQNERTLFSFLFAADLTRPVGPPELFDYFSDEMRTDTGAGGTYRRWLETESALSKVAGDDVAERVLKTACLMTLGLVGERSALNRQDLIVAASGYSTARSEIEGAVEKLISRNLLLHRRNADSVSVWHGTDLDLRGRLEAEKARRRPWFDLPRMLDAEFPAPVVRPLEHNSKSGVGRYLRGSYLTLPVLEQRLCFLHGRRSLDPGVDGEIWFVLPHDQEQYDNARRVIESSGAPDQVVIALPHVAPGIEEAGLEVECLTGLQSDRDISSMDPLATSELGQLLDDARLNLARIVDRMTRPAEAGPSWWIMGGWRELRGEKELRRVLSSLMDRVFPLSPCISSEAVVRHQPTRIMVNARKKLSLAILERYGEESLGIQGNFPDASMFRSVLIHTGLYRPSSDGFWRFARPDDLQDSGLSEVWRRFERLLTEPSHQPKRLDTFLQELQQPPMGLRRGLHPILFSAALRAFPSARSLARKGEYLPDILPSVVEDICRSPRDYELVVLEMSDTESSYLARVLQLLGKDDSEAGEDLIRQCFDAIQAWMVGLPNGVLKSRRFGREASLLRQLVVRSSDPVDLLFRQIPHRIGKENSPGPKTLTALEDALHELASYGWRQREAVRRCVLNALSANSAPQVDPREVAREWAQSLPKDFLSSLNHPPAGGLVATFCASYDSEDRFLEAVAAQVAQMPLRQWEDRVVGLFDLELQRLVDHIELSAITWTGRLGGSNVTEALQSVAKRRLRREVQRVTELLGPDDLKTFLARLVEG